MTLLLFFALSIVFSFLCSVWEAVLLSITPSYVNARVQDGSSMGKTLQEYKDDIDKPLSAILTLNTIAHTVGAIGVGAQAGKMFGNNELSLGPLHLSYESIIAGLMTLAILILSEIIPKTWGANNWKSLAPFTIKSLKALLWILAPFVWMSQLITKTLKKEKEKSVLSRSDFVAMTNVAAQSGEIRSDESAIISNLLNFEKLSVRDIMSPKPVALFANAEQSIKEFYDEHEKIPYSRIPLYEDNSDNLIGMVLKDDLYQNLAEDKHNKTLKDIKKPISFVEDTTTLPNLFDKLTRQKSHLSAVVDEFGNVTGVVTMEDLFETLLGREIIDESDTVADLQQMAREKWEKRKASKLN